MGKLVAVRCDFCGKGYQRNSSHANYAARHGLKQFCSAFCKNKFKTLPRVSVSCLHCDIIFEAREAEARKFCSQTCSASYMNKGRIKTQATKDRIAASIRSWHKSAGRGRIITCAGCANTYTRKQEFCSIRCRLTHNHGFVYDDSRVVSEIQAKSAALGSIHSSKTDSRLRRAASHFYGTWSKSVVAAGLQPNMRWVVRRQIPCLDGHVADSISEKIVDDWLHQNGVAHERHRRYPEGRYTCDFYLPEQDAWVEYLGLYGEHRDYDATVEIKRDIAKRHGLTLIEVFPHNLYPTLTLQSLFVFK